MSLALILAVAAAAAWYVQQQRRPGAGASAAAEARRLRTPLVRLAEAAGIETARGRHAKQWDAGVVGEKATAARLAPLVAQGWTILHDLGIPGSRANIDHIAISPAGVVFVINSKRFSARYDYRVASGRLMRDDQDITDWVKGSRHEGQIVAARLGCPVIVLVSMDGPRLDRDLVLDGMRIVAADRVVPLLRSLSRRHRAAGGHPGRRAAAIFLPYGKK
ncbi:NERD domain protein [Actinobacteria bacterium OV450]|nr:NERD domain protein [Actinobacteria bacterium OV450]